MNYIGKEGQIPYQGLKSWDEIRKSFLADKVFRDLDGDEIFIANLTSTQRQGPMINNNETYTVGFNPKGEVSLLKTDYVDHCGAILCKSGTEIHSSLSSLIQNQGNSILWIFEQEMHQFWTLIQYVFNQK